MPQERTDSTPHDGRLLKPGQEVDRYVVEAIIGAGGTATVYKVRHRELDTAYALKVLSLLSPSIRRRTLQEGKVQASLKHPNIVAVYDVLEIADAPGLLMEYVQGPSLEVALERFKFTPQQAEVLFRGILEGVREAHNFGLVHRDLKPANVLLADTAKGVVPKVTDFGIAKVVENDGGNHTRAGVAMGTPQYMAPEQIRDARSVDARADIFSLGCLLYELLTHRRAFPYDDIVKVYNAVCDGEFVPPRELVPDLAPRLENAILGCLVVDRDRRIPDCATLRDVFEGRVVWGDDDDTELLSGLDALDGLPDSGDHTATFLPPNALSESLAPAVDEPDDLDTSDLATDHNPAATLVGPATIDDAAPRPAAAPRRAWLLPGALLALVLAAMWSMRAGSPPPLAEPGAIETHEAGSVPAASASIPAPAAPPVATPLAPPVAQPVAPPVARPVATAAQSTTPRPPTASVAARTPSPTPQAAAKPTPAAVAVAKPTPAAVAAAAPAEPTPRPKSTTPITAKLLTAPPVAVVWIDAREIGRTPQKLDLAPGIHSVRVKSGDAEGEFAINVKDGAANKWCYVFAEARLIEGSCP
jgi:serine/threonine protein kinase